MKVATYTRTSTDEERQPFSLDAQGDRLSAYIASQDGWHLVRSFTDQQSGKTLDRPDLQRALADARLGSYELLLVHKVDRLARSVRGLAQILEDLDAAGVAFRSATEPFDTSTAAGRMMVQMLGVFAEFERATIVERTVMGLAKKAAKGEWTGGTAPFGYRYANERGLLVPVPDEALIVEDIFKRYASRRHGSAAISGWLNDEAIHTRRGGRWTPQRVIDLLRNTTYIGELPFKGESFQSQHESIVDRETFDLAQAVLDERGERYPLRRGNPTEYLLTSKLRCFLCHRGFVGTASHGRGGAYRYYTCFTRQRHGTARCSQDRIPAQPVEEGVLASLLTTLRDKDLLAEAAARALEQWNADQPDHERELARVEEKIRKGRSAIDRYLRAFETGSMPEFVCSDRLKELQAEILTLEASREQLLVEQEGSPQAPPEELLELAVTRLEEAVDHGEPQTVKSLLSALIDRVEVEGRHAIRPIIRVDGVRIVSGQRRRTGIEPGRGAAPRRRRVRWHRAWRGRRRLAGGRESNPPGGAAQQRGRVRWHRAWRVRRRFSGGGRESNPPTGGRPAHRF
jgi:site-specific DNA recombinase